MASMDRPFDDRTIAILIPCHNEETTIAKVVADFARELPGASIYVYDNRSTDFTADRAREAGAVVGSEARKGKGYVVRRMFREVEADYYVMVDGDDTYPSEHVWALLEPVTSGKSPMAVGTRLSIHTQDSFRPMHRLGNKIIRSIINVFYQTKLTDVLSGYRAFDRGIVKSLPLSSKGFEIEVELTIEALDKGYIPAEVPIPYRGRPVGSESKLNTYKDGLLVITAILHILKDYRPLLFFTAVATALFMGGVWFGYTPATEYMTSGFIHRLGLAFISIGLIVLSAICLTAGLILDSLKRRHQELCMLLGEIRGTRPPGNR
jgi:glycosyltransferase involved in cell wall biosynthesis